MQCQVQFPCWKWSLGSVDHSAICSPVLSCTHSQRERKTSTRPLKRGEGGGYCEHTGGSLVCKYVFSIQLFLLAVSPDQEPSGIAWQTALLCFYFQCYPWPGLWVKALRCPRSQPWVLSNLWCLWSRAEPWGANLQRWWEWTAEIYDAWSGPTLGQGCTQ